MKNHAPFEFFESDDRAAIAAYIALRRRSFRTHYPWLPADFGGEDETDRSSCKILARCDGVIRGGARLTVAAPQRGRKLPLEECGYDLRKSQPFAELHLDDLPYAEISRMAVAPEVTQGLDVSRGLARELCRAAARRGVDAIFSICPDGPARLNRLNAKRCGVAYHIYAEIQTVFGVPMWLCAFTGILAAYARPIEEAAA